MRGIFACITLLACAPSFEAPSDVTDLRVLAIEAEPPEVRFAADAGAVDPIRVSLLAVDPSRPVGLAHLDICAPTDSRRCDTGPVLDGGTVPLSFSVSGLSPALLNQLAAAAKLGDFDGIRVQLSFTLDDGDPHGPLYADKVLIFSRAASPCAPNRNPSLSGVGLTVRGADAGVLDGTPLQRDLQYGVRPILAPGAREDYCTVDLRGRLVQLREQPRYSFFTTAGGDFDRDTADEPLDGGAPPDGLARFTPHGANGTLWVVVRDGRGGESWVSYDWTAR